MRGLPLLIKLARTDADQRRCELGRIAAARADARMALAAHDEATARETETAGAALEMRAAYGTWLRVAGRRRAELAEREAQMARTEEAARAALREAVIEMKKFEVVQRNVVAEADRDAARKEAARADELHATRVRHAE
jgi:flagellar protein FliJ